MHVYMTYNITCIQQHCGQFNDTTTVASHPGSFPAENGEEPGYEARHNNNQLLTLCVSQL